MKRGLPRPLHYTARHGQLTAAHSIRDFYDALVELVTNADDAYHHNFTEGNSASDGGPILVEVEPHRGNRPSVLRVRDRATGFRNLLKNIENVGDRTSDRGDRGFMARGLKDCAAVGHVKVETIVDGRISKAEITPGFQVIPYEPSRRGGDPATSEDRIRLGVQRGNGTVVELVFDTRIRVPLLETLRRDLAWHFALRDILKTGSASSLLLAYAGATAEPIRNVEPDAEAIYDRESEIPGYAGRFRFTLKKAELPLDDPSDPRFRRSGILVKGARANFGCSFLNAELERDPAADRYFGRIECDDIDLLAEEWDQRRAEGSHPADNPFFILDPGRREGLNADHPFVEALYSLPARTMKEAFERDRHEREQSRKAVEARETTDRLRRLAREASRFMREKLEDLGGVAPGDVVDDKSFNRTGIGISPVFAKIPIGTEKTFFAKVDNRRLDLPPGTPVQVEFSAGTAGALELVGNPSPLEPDPLDNSMLKGSFAVRGVTLSQRTRISCQVDGLEPVHAEAAVVPTTPEALDVPGGLAFHRKRYTVRLGGRRTLVLRSTANNMIGTSPRIILEPGDVAIIKSRSVFERLPGTRLNEAEVVVQGRKPNGRARVIAEVNGRRAQCELQVALQDEEGVALQFRLVDYDLGANYRAVWDRREPNTLLITTKHESTGRYLGGQAEGYPGQNGGPFRVLLAELIADNVCRRIVEEHARAQPHQFDSDKIYLLHNRLMKEFTPVAHRIQLADAGP